MPNICINIYKPSCLTKDRRGTYSNETFVKLCKNNDSKMKLVTSPIERKMMDLSEDYK